MQALSRALSRTWGACSSSGRLAARSFSDAAAGAGAGAGAAAPASASAAAAEAAEGAKAKLFKILGASETPLTAAQVWEAAQQEGLRSKRFTKIMLQQLKEAGWVKTQPMMGTKKQKHFGYRLNEFRQQQRQAAAAKRAAKQGV